jgi:hypothetical protein
MHFEDAEGSADGMSGGFLVWVMQRSGDFTLVLKETGVQILRWHVVRFLLLWKEGPAADGLQHYAHQQAVTPS